MKSDVSLLEHNKHLRHLNDKGLNSLNEYNIDVELICL